MKILDFMSSGVEEFVAFETATPDTSRGSRLKSPGVEEDCIDRAGTVVRSPEENPEDKSVE